MDQKQFYSRVGARVREVRGRKMTQEELAKAAGLSRVSLLNIESGRQKLLLHHLLAISAALAMPPCELIAPLLPENTEGSDLGNAGDAEPFVRAALQNLSKGVVPEFRQ